MVQVLAGMVTAESELSIDSENQMMALAKLSFYKLLE